MAALVINSETTTHAQVRSGFLPDRIVHLHPTRLCNLACLHCYSESGPKERAALDLDVLRRTLPLLKDEGYNLISLSGGEPLTYSHLIPLVDYAHSAGFRVTMITNGLFTNSKMDQVSARLDGIATEHPYQPQELSQGCLKIQRLLEQCLLEITGMDAITLQPAAGAQGELTGLLLIRAISLTRDAIPDLPELADKLVGLGAKALQVRPVALAGRARLLTGFSNFTATDHARLYLVVLALQEELSDQARIHCDLAPARSLWQQRDAYAALLASCDLPGASNSTDHLLADLINPLVITETGALKPVAYDFNSHFDLMSLDEL